MVASTSASLVIFQGNKFRYVNRSHELLTGYSADELYSMNFWDNAHPDYKEIVKKRGLARQKGDPSLPASWSYKILTKSGEERWIQVRPSYFEYNGKPAAIATVVNVTDQKLVEEGLERIIKSRTADLSKTNILLKKEILERKKIATVLRKRERELRSKSETLERINMALKVLLKAGKRIKLNSRKKYCPMSKN